MRILIVLVKNVIVDFERISSLYLTQFGEINKFDFFISGRAMRAWTQLFERGPALATLCIFLVFATQTYAGKYIFFYSFKLSS